MTDTPSPKPGEFLLYQTEDGRTRVECRFLDETLWLSQAGIAELFQVKVPTVNEHLKKLYAEGEIRPEATIRQYLMVRQEGRRQVNRHIDHYNLDAILAVGYRVRSPRGTQFRRWATERLREYLVKGFTLDDERLKNPPVAGSAVPDRFDELLERIRDIRASERRMYLRVREIFAMAADYSPSLAETKMSKKQADAHAEAQYEEFAARRRALLEAEGEEFSMRALEDAAKALPKPKGK